MSKRRFFAVLVASTAVCGWAGAAGAVTVFSDNFESTPVGTKAELAVPQVADYGATGWYGVNFGTGGSAGASGNAKVTSESFYIPTFDRRANLEKSTGFALNLDTTGFSEVFLSLEWNTRGTDPPGDFFRVDYLVSAAVDAALFAAPDAFHNLSAYVGSLTNLFMQRGDSNDQFALGPLSLPTGTSSLWVFFTLDDGSGDFGQFDNVLITATPVPLPAALPLLATGLGAMGLLGWRKRRKALSA
jgi:hypothetical protein